MSGYDYRSKSGYAEGSHSDYLKGRPIISYDAATGTRTYATRIESRVGGSFKYPTSQVKVDPLMEKYGRPREVEDFITQLLDEVNGAPDLATSPNPGPNWGRRSSPVKVYPTRDYEYDDFAVKSKIFGYHGDPYSHWDRSSGRVYDQPPQRDDGARNNRYSDSYHMKPDASKDYEAPKKWERSPPPVYDPPYHQYVLKDHESPKNQWGNSSIMPHTLKDHEVPKKQRDKSSSYIYDDYFPKIYPVDISKDHGGTDSRWGNSVGKPGSPNKYGTPSSHRWSSYEQPPAAGHAGGAPKNHGTSNKHWDRSSSPIYDHPPPTKSTDVPSSGWNNSVNPQSPKGHRVPNNQWDRSSSPIYDHPPPTKSSTPNVPGSQWGNSLTKPQLPNGYEVPNNRWDRSSNPVYDHHTPTKSTNPSIPGSRGGNPLMKPQSPKGHGVPNNQWDSYHDQPTRTKNIEGVHSVPSSGRGGNSLIKPQYPKDPGVSSNQWDRLSNPIHDNPLATSDTRGVPGAPNSRWGNSLMKPQSPRDNGASNNQRDRSSSPSLNDPQPTRSTGGLPNDRWGSSSVKPQSPKGHGVPNSQWNRSPSSVHDHPLPSKNIGGVLSSIPNSPTKSESPKDYGLPHDLGNKQSRFVPDDPPQSGKLGKVSNNQWSDVPVKPESPKGPDQWDRSSSPIHDHPPLTGNTFGVPNSKLGYSSVNPQSPKKANNPYDEQIGNTDNYNHRVNKPDDYSYDRQPEKYGASNSGMKPDSYYSNPPKLASEGATQRSSAPNNHPISQSKLSYPSSVRPK